MNNQQPKINTENLPSREDIHESLHLVEKRREYYTVVQNPEWFRAREAQLQARIDEANRDLVALHDSLKRAPEVLKECQLHELHLQELLQKHNDLAAERRAAAASARKPSPVKKTIPPAAMAALKKAFTWMSEEDIIQMMNRQ